MKCENITNELYETSLAHMGPELINHLQSCKACEDEYLKIKRLEQGFLNADKKVRKSSNMARNLSVAMAVTCVLAFQGLFEDKVSLESPQDFTQIAYAHAIDETESFLSEDVYDIDFLMDSSFEEVDQSYDDSDFDVYDYAITAIETTIYNDALEG